MSARPDSCLRLIDLPGAPAPREFYLRDTRRVARELLNAWLVRRVGRQFYGARLTEVEAYLGVDDPAAHSYRGRKTPRVAPMYLAGGHLYVFLVYGLHRCANVVTREEGTPQAVLLRAAGRDGVDPRLLAGPGKLCRALAIDVAHSALDVVGSDRFAIYPDPLPARRIVASPRIGVDYAGDAARWPLRFCLAGAPSLSRPA
jgi:DNA-3-methyladenine glycosylase